MSLQGKAGAGDTLRGKINSIREVRIDPYDIAVQNGFDGTKEDWLKKLVGDSELLESVNVLHAWKKISLESIGETELSNAILSYYNPGSTSDLSNNVWDTVSYSNTIDIVDGELVLVNPTTFVMSNDSDYKVVKGKYIKTGYDNNFYRIPRDATISFQKPTYGNSNYISSSVAMHLTVVDGSLLGYVVSDESDSYPINGEQGGFWYEHIGLVIDTSDATAEESDMAKGVTAYVDGKKVTGTLPDGGMVRLIGGKLYGYFDLDGNSGVLVESSADKDRIIRAGDEVGVVAKYDQFGDAIDTDVVAGKTFTSGAGLLVRGQHICKGVELPDLGDTAAQPTDIALGKVLYDDKGNPVTGTLAEWTPALMGLAKQPDSVSESSDHSEIQITSGMYNPMDFIGRSTLKFRARVPASLLGNATANQVAKGATFTSADGLLVPGTLPDGGGLTLYGGTPNIYIEMKPGQPSVKGITVNAKANTDRIIRAGDEVSVGATNDQFGDAMPGDVRKGKTFTSAAGILVKGEHECEGGVELPALGDTAAQSTDIALGKTLYDENGNPVTGTLYEADSIDEALFANSDFTFGGTPGGTTFSVKGAYAGGATDIVVRKGAGLGIRNAPTNFFGDAMPGDVAKGKTFTSAAGLLVEGTHECEAGGDTSAEDGIITRTITEYRNDRVTSLGPHAFRGCSDLLSADFSLLTKIGVYGFSNCSKLNTLILRSNQVCTLTGSGVFTSTPFNDSTSPATLYVPAHLVESYKTATNWSSGYNNGYFDIVAIEGSEYE